MLDIEAKVPVLVVMLAPSGNKLLLCGLSLSRDMNHRLAEGLDIAIFEWFLPQLLHDPNAQDPLNHDAADILIKDKEQFEQDVKSKEL